MVTRDVPGGEFAAGNPCQVVPAITDKRAGGRRYPRLKRTESRPAFSKQLETFLRHEAVPQA